MYGIVCIPTEILDEINRRLDKAIALFPAAEKERDSLRAQIVGFVSEHDYIPEFTITPKQNENQSSE